MRGEAMRDEVPAFGVEVVGFSEILDMRRVFRGAGLLLGARRRLGGASAVRPHQGPEEQDHEQQTDDDGRDAGQQAPLGRKFYEAVDL
jgi:hypothetical protein